MDHGLKKAQATYDEIYNLQHPFTPYINDKLLISHEGIAKIVTLEDLAKTISKSLSIEVFNHVSDGLAKVAKTGSYFDLIGIPFGGQIILKSPSGKYWRLGVNDDGDLYLNLSSELGNGTALQAPNGKYWQLQVNNEGNLNLVEVKE